MKNAMMALILMVTATGALAQEARCTEADLRPAAETRADVTRTAAPEALVPAAPAAPVSVPVTAARPEPARGEFAGTTILRFFERTVDAVREGSRSTPLPATAAMRMAAY